MRQSEQEAAAPGGTVGVMDRQIIASPETDNVSAMAPTAVLNCVATPIFLTSPDGLIVHLNIAGSELLSGNRALRNIKSRLVARRSSEAKLLAGLLLRVAESHDPEMLCLSSRDGSVSLVLTVTPVPGRDLLAVAIADLQPLGPSLTSFLRRAFGLSSQSAQLAESLMYGLSLAEFSVKTGVTLGAARTRLKNLFARTGNKSQAALVSMLWRAATISTTAPIAKE